MIAKKTKPSFSKEYANRVSQADFVNHFKGVYADLSEDDLKKEWESLQAEKKADEKKK